MSAYQEWLLLERRDSYRYLCSALVLGSLSLCYLWLGSSDRFAFEATSMLFVCIVMVISMICRLFQLRELIRKELW